MLFVSEMYEIFLHLLPPTPDSADEDERWTGELWEFKLFIYCFHVYGLLVGISYVLPQIGKSFAQP